LFRNSGISNETSPDRADLLDILEPMNIEARYPTQKDKLLKSLTRVQRIFING